MYRLKRSPTSRLASEYGTNSLAFRVRLKGQVVMLFMLSRTNRSVITPGRHGKDTLSEIQDVRKRASIYLDVMSEIVQIIYDFSEKDELVCNQNRYAEANQKTICLGRCVLGCRFERAWKSRSLGSVSFPVGREGMYCQDCNRIVLLAPNQQLFSTAIASVPRSNHSGAGS